MALIVTQEIERCLTTRQGILTVPVEDAVVSCVGVKNGHQHCKRAGCQGIDVDRLPLAASKLQAHFKIMGQKFRERYQIRGLEPVGSRLWLHGPFPSYDLNNHLADVKSSIWAEAEHGDEDLSWKGHRIERKDLVLPMVFERDMAFNPYADYVFLGYFTAAETVRAVRRTDTNDRSAFEPQPMFGGIY